MIELLVSQGKITREDLNELDCSISNRSFRTYVEGLHAILCNLDHDRGECLFHNETIQDDTWEREEHGRWVEYAKRMVWQSGCSPDRLMDDLRLVSQAINSIQSMTVAGKHILNIILEKSPSLLDDQTLSIPHQNQHEETS